MQISQSTSAAAESAVDQVELTVLMPCLNEAETIQTCIEKAHRGIKDAGVLGEVLIADNGSTDGSQDIARNCNARVVDVEEKGYGSALRAGIGSARGQWIIMGDADDSYDFEKITGFVDKLREGNQLVMGCRLPRGGGSILPGAMPRLHRWIGNPVLSFIGKLLFRSEIDDFHCGLRGFSKHAIEDLGLNTSGMEFASEMVIKATTQDLRVAQIPIVLHKDGRSRPPHLRSFRDGWRHLRFMLLYCPRWLFLYPGIMMIVIGMLASGWLLTGPKQVGSIELDIHTLVYFLFSVVVGFQVVCFGLLIKSFTEPDDVPPAEPTAWRKVVNLESGLIAGLLLALAGIAGSCYAMIGWGGARFGDMDPSAWMRIVLPSVLMIVLGVQVFFNAMFFGALAMRR